MFKPGTADSGDIMNFGIGYRLKLVREKCGLNLDKMSAFFCTSPQTLSRYENGKRTPDIEFIEAFGKKFKISGNWLLYGSLPIFDQQDPGEKKSVKKKTKNMNARELFLELASRLHHNTVGAPSHGEVITVPVNKMTGDSPENYLVLLEYMLKNQELRENIFQFFYLFLKPSMGITPQSKTDE